MAGMARTLDGHGQLMVHGDHVVNHHGYTDVRALSTMCTHHVCLCGLETDTVMVMGAAMCERGHDVSVLQDLCASTMGTGIHLALVAAMDHLFGADHVITCATMS